jgi:phosphatidate cytidylyltransferase
MINRMFSSVLLLVIMALAVFLLGAEGFVVLIIVAGGFTQSEFYKLLRKIGQKPLARTGSVCGFLLMCIARFSNGQLPCVSEFFVISIMAVVLKVLLSHSLEYARSSIIPTVAGIVYIPLMCSFPIELFGEMTAQGLESKIYVFTLFWMILVAKCCDIGGMYAGKYYGKRKLAPNFSPHKTIEGSVGGILLSNLVGVLLTVFFKRLLPNSFNLVSAVILATLLATFSLVGDLTESIIKRLAHEKDSGNVIPGIGGFFDLTDSLLFSIPLGVIFLRNFIL